MNREPFTVTSSRDDMIYMQVTPGHFATSSSHVSHYLVLNRLKKDAAVAMDVATEMAVPYLGGSVMVDTIVCMEGMEIIGAYLAQKLLQEGTMVMNSGGEIYVLTPSSNVNGQLMFPGEQEHIAGRRVILLAASVSSGKTVSRAAQCLSYYGGELVGVSALFAAMPHACGQEIFSLFTSADIPGYSIYNPSGCELCRQGQKLDAIVTSQGCTNL